MCAMLRRSLSSEAAASLITAFTRAASATGSLRPPSNQIVASAVPPRSVASSRMILEDTISEPIAALAIVLAITMRARSSARGGRSFTLVPVTKRASSPAMLIYMDPLENQNLPHFQPDGTDFTWRIIGGWYSYKAAFYERRASDRKPHTRSGDTRPLQAGEPLAGLARCRGGAGPGAGASRHHSRGGGRAHSTGGPT